MAINWNFPSQQEAVPAAASEVQEPSQGIALKPFPTTDKEYEKAATEVLESISKMHNEGYELLHDSIADTEAEVVGINSVGNKIAYTIIFDSNSVDSMLASLYITLWKEKLYGDEAKIKLMPYNRFTGLDTNSDYGAVTVVGVELGKQDMVFLNNHGGQGNHVRVLAYRDQYDITKHSFANIETVWPSSDFINEELALIDNTMAALAPSAFVCDSSLSSFFDDMKMPVIMYTHGLSEKFKYGEVLNTGFVSTQEDKQKAVRDAFANILTKKAVINNLRGVLMKALLGADAVAELKSLKNAHMSVRRTDVDNYRSSMLMVRTNVANNMRTEVFGRGDKTVKVDLMACPITLCTETYSYVKDQSEIFITYDDNRYCRIYRVHAAKAHIREFVAEKLHPIDSWTEGTVLCVATDLPKASK